MPGQAAVVGLPVLHRGYLWGSSIAMALYQFPAMALGGGLREQGIDSAYIGDVDVGGRSTSTMNTDYCISSYSYCVALP